MKTVLAGRRLIDLVLLTKGEIYLGDKNALQAGKLTEGLFHR